MFRRFWQPLRNSATRVSVKIPNKRKSKASVNRRRNGGHILRSPNVSDMLRAYDGSLLEAVEGTSCKMYLCTTCLREVKRKSIYAHLRSVIHQAKLTR